MTNKGDHVSQNTVTHESITDDDVSQNTVTHEHNTGDDVTKITEIQTAYQLSNCSFQINIQISADMGEQGRRVVVGLLSHKEDSPLFTVAQISDFSSLQSVVDELFIKFQDVLPTRCAKAIERYQSGEDTEVEEEILPAAKPNKKTKSQKKPKAALPDIPLDDTSAATKAVKPTDQKVQLSLF